MDTPKSPFQRRFTAMVQRHRSLGTRFNNNFADMLEKMLETENRLWRLTKHTENSPSADTPTYENAASNSE